MKMRQFTFSELQLLANNKKHEKSAGKKKIRPKNSAARPRTK